MIVAAAKNKLTPTTAARESWVDLTRVLACFAVVVLHVTVPIVFTPPQGVFSPAWYYGLFYCAAFRWSVPVFVMLSGALLLRPQKLEDIPAFYRKRFAVILRPCLFWTVFYIVLQHEIDSARLAYYEDSLKGILKNLCWGLSYYHLWYLYMLASLYLLAPFLHLMVNQLDRQTLKRFLIVTFSASIGYTLGIHLFGGQTFYWALFPLYTPYFVLGYAIRQQALPRAYSVKALAACALVLISATVILSALPGWLGGNLGQGLYFYDYFSLTMVPLAVVMFLLLNKMDVKLRRSSRALTVVSNCTLGIYLMHPMLIVAFKNAGLSVSNFCPLLSIPSIALLVFGCCFLLERFYPGRALW